MFEQFPHLAVPDKKIIKQRTSVEALVGAATGVSDVSTSPGVSRSVGLASGDCGVTH